VQSKIEQICRTGTCDAISRTKPEWEEPVNAFQKVHGIGPATAMQLFRSGYRTIRDLQSDPQGLLGPVHRIGIKHFEDLQHRIPREEVTEVFELVRSVGQQVLPGCELYCTGSYRRGAATSGDIDILITHPSLPRSVPRSGYGAALSLVVTQLMGVGLLIDHLTSPPHDEKYMGLCRLSRPQARVRRLDLLWVPYGELGSPESLSSASFFFFLFFFFFGCCC
jgi:DNA polymerase/3'-5' exonuclease PolX